MSRSYHVTNKTSSAAFSQDDHEPMFAVSEKTWVKKKEKRSRSAVPKAGKAPPNRAIVARERKRTNNASAVIRYRTGGQKGALNQPS